MNENPQQDAFTEEGHLKVHVASSDVPTIPTRKQKRTVFNTVVLTAGEPVQEILPKSEKRICAYVQAIDNDIVLASSLAQGQSRTNTAASVPSPSGSYLPKANTAPLRLDGNDLIYAAATTTGTNSRVAVTAIYYAD